VVTIADSVFKTCTALTTSDISSCSSLGSSVGSDGVFNAITGIVISQTVPSVLMTCNGGNPDGDIPYLQANNTETIYEV
jgi:hypothetical protein